MSTLYLTEPGTMLRRRSARLVASKGTETVVDVPAFRVERVVVVGPVQVSTQALVFLLEQGIDVSFLSRSGKLRGRLVSSESRNVFLRLAQYDRSRDEGYRVCLARAIVGGKLANQRAILRRHQRNHPEAALTDAIAGVERCLAALPAKRSVDGIMGIEGAGTASYFKGFRHMVRRGLAFDGRQKHPATDPVNALLSFGYVLLTNEADGVLASVGFDPFIGFLHGLRYGRRSLPLDLVEEFRHPVVDGLVLRFCNLGVADAGEFQTQSDGSVRMAPALLKRYLAAYDQRLREPRGEGGASWREVIRQQALRLERTVLEGAAYEPFVAVA